MVLVVAGFGFGPINPTIEVHEDIEFEIIAIGHDDFRISEDFEIRHPCVNGKLAHHLGNVAFEPLPRKKVLGAWLVAGSHADVV